MDNKTNKDKKIEINGNLSEIENFKNFQKYIVLVWTFFHSVFGQEIMSKIDLYIDNATEGSGYTPITTIVLRKYIIIKLGIDNFLNSEQIVYQFSHELCHYVFCSVIGINKSNADDEEESICSAMSLVVLKNFFPKELDLWKEHVKKLKEEKYRRGYDLAESINYDIAQLKDLIIKKCHLNDK